MIPSDPFVYADTDAITAKAPANPGAIKRVMYSRIDDKTMSDMYDAYLRALGYLGRREYGIPAKPDVPKFDFDYTRCYTTPIPPPVISYTRHKHLDELDPRTDLIPVNEYIEREIAMHQQKLHVVLGRGNSKSCTSQLNTLDILYHNNVITLNEYREYAKDILNCLYGTGCIKTEKEKTTMNNTNKNKNEFANAHRPTIAINADRNIMVILGEIQGPNSTDVGYAGHLKDITTRAYWNGEYTDQQMAILRCLDAENHPCSTGKGPDINPFAIKRVIFNDPATIVFWEDGTKTVVKCDAKTDIYDPEKGLAMCFARKALGNKMDYYNTFRRHLKKVMKPKPEESAETITEFKV